MRMQVDIEATDGNARVGSIATPRGTIQLPAFMPVGTRGTIRALPTGALAALSASDGSTADVMLGNTYHLMLRPGAETVAELGGLHAFTGWDRHTLTDSGGFQVFSLDPKVNDEGAEFVSTYDGSRHLLTPESAVHTQELLGADIQMVLDVCPALPADEQVLSLAVERTARWAERARAAHTRTGDQSLFGIVQGGTDVDLRVRSGELTVALDFDGYAVGGLSVGETRSEMLPALEAAISVLPADQPRYLMGVGDPVSIVESVLRGVDMFDCVLPTRLARHGTLLVDDGKLNIKRAEFARSDEPPMRGCACSTCERHSRGYLRHLMAVGEPAGATLCTVHNLHWMMELMVRIRNAIRSRSLAELATELARTHSALAPGS